MQTHDSDSSKQQPSIAPAAPEIDTMKYEMFRQRIRNDQNLSLGILSGAGAALVGAAVWALITALTDWQIGFMAVGVGFLVGYVVRVTGQGIDMSFGIAGAALSLIGCLVGNYLAVCIIIAQQDGVPFMDVLSQIDIPLAIELMIDTFQPMDALFYGLALYYGYKNSFYQPTEQEQATFIKHG